MLVFGGVSTGFDSTLKSFSRQKGFGIPWISFLFDRQISQHGPKFLWRPLLLIPSVMNDSNVLLWTVLFAKNHSHDIDIHARNSLPNFMCRRPKLLQPLGGLKYFEASAKSSAVVFETTVAGCFFWEQLPEWCCPFLMFLFSAMR